MTLLRWVSVVALARERFADGAVRYSTWRVAVGPRLKSCLDIKAARKWPWLEYCRWAENVYVRILCGRLIPYRCSDGKFSGRATQVTTISPIVEAHS